MLKFLHRLPSRSKHCYLFQKSFSSHFLAPFTNGFVDLSLALPIPPSLPTYTTSIIIMTIATRFALSVPISVWAKKRQWRAEVLVLPVVNKYQAQLLQTGPQSRYQLKTKVSIYRRQLFKKYRCSPYAAMLLPPLVNLPLFVFSSLLLRDACVYPSPLDTEAFFTLSSLVSPDGTATLPILVGLLSLAHVESAKWFVGGSRGLTAKAPGAALAQIDENGVRVIKISPQSIAKQMLRAFAVLRILMGMVVPGAVIVYWTASAAFGLLQTWALDFWEPRHKDYLRHKQRTITNVIHRSSVLETPRSSKSL